MRAAPRVAFHDQEAIPVLSASPSPSPSSATLGALPDAPRAATGDLATPLHCEVRPDRELVTVVVHGELDIATAPVLDAHLRELRDAGWDQLVVDLRGLTFIDSTGVHLVLRWTASAADLGHGLRVVLGARARSVFAMTGTLQALSLGDVRRDDGRPGP
jgi:anti-sigma B factor antagonist